MLQSVPLPGSQLGRAVLQTRLSAAGVWQRATTSSQRTTSHSSSLLPYAYGCALMSTRPSTTLADFSWARDSQITFSVTHGWLGLWRGRPWLAGRRIGETSSDVGSSRFWIGWVTKHGDKCARSTCRDWIGPGERKSVQPMAKRLALGACDQLHHFIAAGVWDATPVETELLVQADRLVGGSDAVLVIDDTAIPKNGMHSVGVAAQSASALGKTANCQTLVSLTLARGEVPVVLALRLFLPESWTSKRSRLERAGVPAECRTARTKPEMALAEIDRAIAA